MGGRARVLDTFFNSVIAMLKNTRTDRGKPNVRSSEFVEPQGKQISIETLLFIKLLFSEVRQFIIFFIDQSLFFSL
jgi:hypothetical protein